MSGLSLPLPAVVERVAASLVPWADGVAMSANEALRTGARGSIVPDLDDRSAHGGQRLAGVVTTLGTAKGERTSVISLPGTVVPSLPEIVRAPGAPAPSGPDQGAGYGQPADGGPGLSGPTTPDESPAPAPGPASTTPPEPTQPPVESDPDPVAAVTPVVDPALAPAAPLVEETTKTVVETVAPVLPGLGK